jgi:hypothetical protein
MCVGSLGVVQWGWFAADHQKPNRSDNHFLVCKSKSQINSEEVKVVMFPRTAVAIKNGALQITKPNSPAGCLAQLPGEGGEGEEKKEERTKMRSLFEYK